MGGEGGGQQLRAPRPPPEASGRTRLSFLPPPPPPPRPPAAGFTAPGGRRGASRAAPALVADRRRRRHSRSRRCPRGTQPRREAGYGAPREPASCGHMRARRGQRGRREAVLQRGSQPRAGSARPSLLQSAAGGRAGGRGPAPTPTPAPSPAPRRGAPAAAPPLPSSPLPFTARPPPAEGAGPGTAEAPLRSPLAPLRLCLTWQAVTEREAGRQPAGAGSDGGNGQCWARRGGGRSFLSCPRGAEGAAEGGSERCRTSSLSPKCVKTQGSVTLPLGLFALCASSRSRGLFWFGLAAAKSRNLCALSTSGSSARPVREQQGCAAAGADASAINLLLKRAGELQKASGAVTFTVQS